MSAIAKMMLQDLIEDPKNNGDYKLAIEGEELRRLWLAIEHAERELESLRNAVFATCGHLPGMSQEESLAVTREGIEGLKADKLLFATQLQELAEILMEQPGTVAHFRSVKETALHLVAQANAHV